MFIKHEQITAFRGLIMNRARNEHSDSNCVHERRNNNANNAYRRLLSTTLLITIAFIALIALVVIVSDSAEAGPILTIKIDNNGPTSKEVEPDDTVTWSTATNDAVILENIGDTSSTVNLTIVTLPEYWTANINPMDEITLSSGGGVQRCQLTVYAPPNATHTETGHGVTIKMRDEDNNIDKYLTVSVTVAQLYSLGLNTDQVTKATEPGTGVTYYLNVSNLGNGDDTVNMSLSGQRPGWIYSFSKNKFTVGPFDYTEITFTCTVWTDELFGDYPLTISVTSEDDIAFETANVIVRVNQTYDVHQSPSETTKNILPDETTSYNMTITNKGNRNDTFTITTSPVPAGWIVSTISSITIADAEGSDVYTVTLFASPDALKNQIITFFVNATTGGPSPKTHSQQLTAIVSQVFGVNVKGITLSQSMAPNEWRIFTVNISNTGNGRDEIEVDVLGIPPDWPAPVKESSVTLDPKEYIIFEINITAGSEALSIEPYYFDINISSKDEPAETDSTRGTITITETHGVDVVVLSATQFADPEETISFTIQITNEGNGKDDFDLDDANVPSGWVTTFSKRNIKDLEHGIITEIIYVITPADDATVGINTIIIYGNWSTNNSISASDSIFIHIRQVYEVVVNTADNSNPVIPDSVTTYNLSVRNDGTGEDTFELDYFVDPGKDDVLGWVSLEDPDGVPITSLTLPAGETGYVIMRVDVPATAGGGLKGRYNITLRASSMGNDTINHSKLTVTHIVGVYEIYVSSSVFKGEAAPGNSVDYLIFVQNTGTETDFFDINATGIHDDWVSFDIAPPWVELMPDETSTITVTIAIPSDWDEFGSFDSQIIATSRSVPSIMDSVIFNTTITEVRAVTVESSVQKLTADPGEYAYFEIRVWNDGTAEDTFTIAVPDTHPLKGWVTFPNGTLFTIPNGAYLDINVSILVDEDAEDIEYEINITATSEDEATATDFILLTVDVQQIFKVKIRAYDDNIDGDPNTEIIYEITVWNEGNGEDTFDISADSSWVTVIDVPSAELLPGESVTFNITVDIPAKMDVGNYIINITALSTKDTEGEINQTEQITVKVNPIYDFIVDSPITSAGITPGTSENFTITIENKGTGDDTITLNIEGIKRAWAKLYSNGTEQYQIFIPKGEKATMNLVITVPDDENKATNIIFTINGSSQESVEEIVDTFDILVDIEQFFAGFITTSDPSQTVLPGEFADFTLQINNEGNDWDEFLMSVVNKESGWTYMFDDEPNPTIGPIDTGKLASTKLRVTVDEDEVQGSFTIIIRATSAGDSSVSFTYNVTILVDQDYGVELESSGPSTRDVDIEGGSTAFFVKVFNRGNGIDSLSLSFNSDDDHFVEMSHSDISPAPNDFIIITVWVNITDRTDWVDFGEPPLISIDVEVISTGVSQPSVPDGTKDILTLTADVKDIYEMSVIVTPSIEQNVEIGDQVTFTFTISDDGTTSQNYKATVMDYDPTNLLAPTFQPSSNPFPSSPSTQDQTLLMTISPKSDALLGSYPVWIRISINQDSKIQYHVNVTINIEPFYDVQLRAQNDQTSIETLVNTYANYTLIIKNLGNTVDTFFLGANDPHSQLVSYEPSNITLDPEESGFVTCSVFASQIIIEANSLYTSGIPSEVVVSSKGGDQVTETLALDTDITVTHALSLSSPDPVKDILPGDSSDFTLNVKNEGTTGDKYFASVESFDTSALDNPNFNPGTQFPSSGVVEAGQTTPLIISVSVLTKQPKVPVGIYYMEIRISIQGFPSIYEIYNFTVEVKQEYAQTLEAVDDQKDSDVNQQVNYTLTIKNKGNGDDTFTIRATGEYSSLVTLEFNEITLPQEESADFFVQVFTNLAIVDRDDLYGSFLTTPIEILSKNDPDASANSIELPINTYIEYTYDFTLDSRAAGDIMEAKPSETFFFTLVITNTGTVLDQYTFDVIDFHPAVFDSVSITDKNTNVNPGASQENEVTIIIVNENDKALTGTYDITIKATSKNKNNVNQLIVLHINITAKAQLEVGAAQTGDGEPGDVIDYKFRVTNEGNAIDTFDLALEGTNKEWGVIYDPSGATPITEITLQPYKKTGYFADIIVRVSIPGTGETQSGTFYPITFKVTSRTSDSVSESRQATTEVLDFLELDLDYIGSGQPKKDYDPNQKAPKFSFRVTNNGNQIEEGIIVTVDPADWTYTPETVSEPIDPAGTATFSLEFNVPSNERTGEYELEVYVQSSHDPGVKSEPIFVTVNITKPDLAVSTGDIKGLDDTNELMEKVDSRVTIKTEIHNEGNAEANSVQVKLYVDEVLKGTKSISSIDPERSKEVSFSWTVEAIVTDVRVEITKQEEIEEDNNEATLELDLRPNFSFYGEQINMSKADPAAGDKVTITALIRNTGGNAENVVVKFFDGTKPIGQKQVDIDHDEDAEVSLEWEVPDGDSVKIKAEIDHDDFKGEDEESRTFETGGGGDLEGFLSMSGILMLIIGFIIGALIFLMIGRSMGRGAGGQAAGSEGMAGPSFSSFEKEMGEGADKAAKGPAPFAPMGGEEEAPPTEDEEEAPKPKEAARVRCPKCGRVMEVTSTQRPLQIPCECGTTLMLKK
jgi:uncharacterized membrane protein